MKKEWIVLTLVLGMHYLDTIKEISRAGIHFRGEPWTDFLFLLYHITFYLLVLYVLIPKLFYQRKTILFWLSLLGLLLIYTFVEEMIVEPLLAPSRGQDSFRWQSMYWFIQENAVPLLACVTVKFVFDNFERQQKLEQIEKDSLTNELKFLKSQIQPHILFNSLNNLYDYTLSKSDKAPELVLQLSNVLRYVLYETSDALVPLSKELGFIRAYVDLQKMQLEGRGEIEFAIKQSANMDALKIAPFLLIPFIENSFKHSLGSKERGIIIDIQISIQDNTLQLLVENNFEAIASNSEGLMTKGIGLENVQKRLALLYPNCHQLTITNDGDLYKVVLHLQLVEEQLKRLEG